MKNFFRLILRMIKNFIKHIIAKCLTSKSEPIRVVSLFSGIDTCLMAFNNLGKITGLRYKLMAWCDNDPHCIAQHNFLYPEHRDLLEPDVTTFNCDKVLRNGGCDIIIYSSCCQSVSRSNRSKKRGLTKGSGTESAKIWMVEPVIAKLRPRVLLFENVEGILDKCNYEDFSSWCRMLASYGYVSKFKKILGGEFGCPQNRPRTFMVSILKDEKMPNPTFAWPNPVPLTVFPEHLLSENVDDQYYLTTEQCESFVDLIRNADKGYVSDVIYRGNHPHKYLTSQMSKMISRVVFPITKNGSIPTLMASGTSVNLAGMTACRREGMPCVIEVWEGQPGIQPVELVNVKAPKKSTHTTAEHACRGRKKVLKIIEGLKSNQYLRIRRLTPEEALRFMGCEQQYIDRLVNPRQSLTDAGYTPEQINELMKVNGKKLRFSDSHIYKRAGNSIIVQVLVALFSSLFLDEESSVAQQLWSTGLSIEEQACEEISDEMPLSPAEKKRKYQREYYHRNREKLSALSRKYHQERRVAKKNLQKTA